jgi:hypothetical protein
MTTSTYETGRDYSGHNARRLPGANMPPTAAPVLRIRITVVARFGPQNDISVAAPSREAKLAGVLALVDADDARYWLSPGSAAMPAVGSPAWSQARK